MNKLRSLVWLLCLVFHVCSSVEALTGIPRLSLPKEDACVNSYYVPEVQIQQMIQQIQNLETNFACLEDTMEKISMDGSRSQEHTCKWQHVVIFFTAFRSFKITFRTPTLPFPYLQCMVLPSLTHIQIQYSNYYSVHTIIVSCIRR